MPVQPKSKYLNLPGISNRDPNFFDDVPGASSGVVLADDNGNLVQDEGLPMPKSTDDDKLPFMVK
jgi:hypothetical protein